MVKPLILRNKDICIIFDCSPATSSRKMQTIKDALSKKPHQIITIREFCEYFDLQVNEVIEKMNFR
jgi:hypothetical protein